MNNRQITLQLITRTGLHIGSGYGDATTDALLRRDGQGFPIIPGTSLAGALRAMATRLAPRLGHAVCQALMPPPDKNNKKEMDRRKQPCGCTVCQLFGDINPAEPGSPTPKAAATQEQGASAPAKAARLWVYDAHLLGSQAAWIRDGVGIERATRAAYRQGQVKFDLEVLPPGAKFELRLELQTPDKTTDVEAEEQLLAAVLAEWVAGRAAIGGRVSRGLGAFALQEGLPIVYHHFDLNDGGQLLTYLLEDAPWPKGDIHPGWLADRLKQIEICSPAKDAQEGIARAWVQFKAVIQADGPFLINSPVTAAESGFDHAPLLAGGKPDRPLLPGSSLKGALRSQAERIARTLAARKVYGYGDLAEQAAAFLKRCPACDPLVGEGEQALASCDALLKGKEASDTIVETTDEVEDRHLCLACRLFGNSRRGSRLRVEDAPSTGRVVYKPMDFLAIDRFTGGGADQFKFDAIALWQPEFKLNLFLENPCDWELGWLLLTLRDIHDGLATLGFGASKGFGRVRAKSWSATVGYLTDEDKADLHILAGGQREPDSLYHTLTVSEHDLAGWQSPAQTWIEAFVAEVDGFERARDSKWLPALAADTYFGRGIESLYPVKKIEREDVHA